MQQVSEITERGDYDAFLTRLQARFISNVGNGPLFTTDATGLWAAYLESISEGAIRQYHNCHACRQFIERFGGLVTIAPDGSTAPAIWNEADDHAEGSVAAMARAVRRAKVTGVHRCSANVWGQPVTGTWRHMAVRPPAPLVYRRVLLTAGQAMAEKREDFKRVMHALAEFTQPMIEQALTLLRTDSLYRSEKVLGQAEWLYNLHVARAAAKGERRRNVVWLAVANAPAGFCHPRSSMIGTLLEDIAAGKDFTEVTRAFAAKMHPLRYQRPQAAPTAGAIAAAEKVMAELGAAGALERRFCRLEEVQAIWIPAAAAAPQIPVGGGVFSHLQPKSAATQQQMEIPPVVMTWDKFSRTVLPEAQAIEYLVPRQPNAYAALVTAVNPDAPPILQWDTPEARNPVSWYFWHGGSLPSQFGLKAGTYCKVVAVTLKPSQWNGNFSHHGEAVLFVLDGARESRNAGAALFPETLKPEFHGIRSVIEAYSRGATIAGMEEPHVVGLMLQKKLNWSGSNQFRVTTQGRKIEYRLDRWD